MAILCLSISVADVEARRTISGGTVVIEEGETVEGFAAFGANVIIKGDVKGDVEAFAANIEVSGNIDGDLKAYGANIEIDGKVTGDAETFGANIDVKENATLQGSIKAGGANVIINGVIGEDVEIDAENLKLGPGSIINGNLEYEAKNFEKDEDAKIEGTTRIKETKSRRFEGRKELGVLGPLLAARLFLGLMFAIYWFLVSLAFGAVLLIAAPDFTDEVSKRAIEEPITMGAIGLLVIFSVPLLLIALLITIIGIPLSILGGMLFAVLVFIASIYGKYTVGMWILIKKEKPDPWKALILGLLIGALLGFIPILGGIIKFLILVLGLGALSYTLKVRIRKEKDVAGKETG